MMRRDERRPGPFFCFVIDLGKHQNYFVILPHLDVPSCITPPRTSQGLFRNQHLHFSHTIMVLVDGKPSSESMM